jgi:hypothetical protein
MGQEKQFYAFARKPNNNTIPIDWTFVACFKILEKPFWIAQFNL